MSDSGISESRQRGYHNIRDQNQSADSIDLNSLRASNSGSVRGEVTAIESPGADVTQKRQRTQPKVNAGHRPSVSLPTVVVAVFTLAGLATCLVIISSLIRNKATFKSSSLIGHGGSFTQPQAKTLDLIASAIVAPLFMSVFNLYCFKSARATAVNEKSGLLHSLYLRTLIEVSTTDRGSYDLFKVFELGKAKQARLVILALLTLASAISFSALGNFVAYEAFVQDAGTNTSASLQYLYRKPDGTIPRTGGGYLQMPRLSTKEQQAQFTSQWFQVLTALSYRPAGPFLDHDSYIGINMTNASLARLSSEMTHLFAVPAYKLSYDCQPVTSISASLVNMGPVDSILAIDVFFLINSNLTDIYRGDIKNGVSTILSAENGVYQFLAFPFGPSASFMLGNIGSFNTSNSTTVTSFGPLSHFAFNNTLEPFSGSLGTKIVLSVWGVNCTLARQQGTVDLNRDANNTIAGWKRSRFTPLPSPLDKKEPLTPIIRDLQIYPAYVAPEGTIPGLGGALAVSASAPVGGLDSGSSDNEDFETWVQNFLYAEGEARRIAYETALQHPAPGNNDSRLAYTVVAQSAILSSGQ